MATKFTYDTANRVFLLNAGITTLDARSEFYSAAKLDWKNTDALNKFAFPIESIGGQDIGGGNTISPYYSLQGGWRIQFPLSDLAFAIVGNVITVEGDAPVIDNPGPYHHVVQYQVSANSLTTGRDEELAAIAGIPGEVWLHLIEGDESAEETVRLLRAGIVGEASGAGTNTMLFKSKDGSTTRIEATVTNEGNRPAVIVNPA